MVELWRRFACLVLGHDWDIYRDPPRKYALYHCDRCGQVSTQLGGEPTVWREPTTTEQRFLSDNFHLVYPRRNRRR